MNKIPLKSGGHILVLDNLNHCPENEICFTKEEYDWAKKLSLGFTQDPEAQKSFWATLIEKKKLNKLYSLFLDFPPSLSDTALTPKREFPGAKICEEVIAQLKGLRREP